jgi:phage/plasmid-like protein (TIGR03299 family)
MPHAVESMFSANVPAWHQLGVVTKGALTSAEAIEKAGLDWTVSLNPLFVGVTDAGGEEFPEEVPNFFATVRDMDNGILGVVGNRYVPIQNIECFDFIDTVVDDSDAMFETAGSLHNGRIVWMLLNLNKSVQVDEDITHNYLLLTNSHDGSSSLKGLTTPIRVVCANTLRMALGDMRNSFSFRHTKNLTGKVAQARSILTQSYNYVDAFQLEMEKLLDTEITNDRYKEIMDTVLPIPEPTQENVKAVTRISNIRGEITTLFNKPEFETQKNTAWALINATSNYEQWRASIRGKSSRSEKLAQKTLLGNENIITNKVHQLVG